MQTEGRLSCSQGTATGPYPEPHECSAHNLVSYIFKIHFIIIIIPPMTTISK